MWIVLSLFSAIWSAVANVAIKTWLAKIRPFPLLFILSVFNLPLIVLALLFWVKIPQTPPLFFVYVLTTNLLDILAYTCYFFALYYSAVSLVTPFAAFNPIFTTILAMVFLQETPTPVKFLGIFLTVVGTYALHIADAKISIWEPFRKLASNKGVRLYLLAQFLWSITPLLQKKAVYALMPPSPFFTVAVSMVFTAIILSIFNLRQTKKYVPDVRRHLWFFLLFGVMTILSFTAKYTAFSLQNVGYVSAILKMSSLFSIISGGLLLKEGRIREKLLGGSIMLAGAIIVAM